ncbi:PucR family transcriptional regulator [Herbiconiux sp. P17]|uniref:PucR family transcriptional regulator n=1 Tax=Herbiconiux wuyangfengii TaxID=3342794 RepID=UPI0035BB5184
MHTDFRRADESDLRVLVQASLDDMGALVDVYLTQLKEIDGYARLDIPPQDLLDTTSEAIELILRKAVGLPLLPGLESASEAIGRRRAAQGVPLELLLQAVRMVFRVLWTTLHERATLAQQRALDRSPVQLWEAIEFHTVRVHAGYLDEQSRMRRDRETEISILLSAYLERERPDATLTNQLARTLGLVPDDSFLIAAAPLTVVAELRSRIGSVEPRAQLHTRSDSVLILIPNAPWRDPPLDWAVGLLVAVAPAAVGLADVPRVWRIAHDLLLAAPAGAGLVTLSDGWPALVATSHPELAGALRAEVFGTLDVLTPSARALVVSTVEAYLRSGSLSETARQLFVHRNTVLKRLGRFAMMTGLDPSTPWDAATIRVALS